jgi:hypothetical protein
MTSSWLHRLYNNCCNWRTWRSLGS